MDKIKNRYDERELILTEIQSKLGLINKRLQRFAKTTDSMKVSTNEESRPKTIEPLNSDFWN